MSGLVKGVKNLVSGVVKAVGTVIKGVVSAVGNVVSSVINFVVNPFLGLFGLDNKGDIPNQDSSIKGVTVTTSGSDVSIPIVYGYRKVGGTITFAETGSDNNKYLHVAYVLSEGPIVGLRELTIDENVVGAANIPNLNNSQTVTITDDASGKLKNRVQLFLAKGNTDTVGTAVKAGVFATAPNWTTSMQYRGLAVLFARYEWVNSTDQKTAEQQPFSGSIPKIEATMLGKYVTKLTTLDISNPSTIPAYGSDAQFFAQTYSTNPADIILDYLRNGRYGKGALNSDIDWDSFKKSATKFDQQVTYTANGVTGPIQTMHAVVDTGTTIFNNIKLMLQNCRSYLPYSRNGTYKLIVEDAGNATDILSGSAPIAATFNKNNIQGTITYSGIERTSKYNQVCVTYCDPDQQWSSQQVFVPATNSPEHLLYLAQDGERANKGDFTFAWITNFAIAGDMGRLILQKSRNQDTISFTASSQAMELEVGDSIYVDSNILKFGTDPNANPAAIAWRIVSTKVNNDYTVTLGCVRNENNLYPYVRQNDRDYKLAVFVPKGATRYYPPEPAGIPIGLKPPTTAPTSPSDATNPIDRGVINPLLVDVLSIFDTAVAIDGTGSTYATLKFNRPNNPTIISAMFYYKQNINDTAATYSSLERPLGALDAPNTDGSYSIRLGPLAVSPWIVKSRIKYVTGDLSSRETTTTFTVTSPTGGTDGTGGGGTPVTPPSNLANNFIKVVTGATVTSGTAPNQIPLATRKITVSITQDMGLGNNGLLNGIQVFYKPSVNPKWFTKTIPTSVTQGTAVTFELEVGSRIYPLVMGTGAPVGADKYDFIFRYTYSDGKNSVWQYRAMNQPVEDNGFNVYQFAVFVYGMGNIFAKEGTDVYVPEIAGPNDILETRNMVAPMYSIRQENGGSIQTPTNPSMRIYIEPPVLADRTNWVGVRVYYHRAGVTPVAWSSLDFTPATYGSVGQVWSVLVPVTYDANWEFAVTTLVTYGASTAESLKGQYFYGYVHNRTSESDYPADSNWARTFIVSPMETLVAAKARLGTAPVKSIRTDTYFDSITANTVLDVAQPFSPRRLTFTVKTSTANGANGSVAKVRIYYKFSSNLYWKYSDYPISAENTNITFTSAQTTPAMDIGFPSYPTTPFLADNYDFYFRIIYSDGTGSKYAAYYASANVEKETTYNFNPFANMVFQQFRLYVDLVLEENAPPGAVTNPKDISINCKSLVAMGNGPSSGNASFAFDDPVPAMQPYYAGIRIYRRDLTPGADSTYIINDSGQPLTEFSTDLTVGYAYQPINWDTDYSYLLTPMVWYQGALTPATNSISWRGKIHNRVGENIGANPYPVTPSEVGNWFSRTPATTVNTADALAALSVPIVVTDPVVTMISMKEIVNQQDPKLGYFEIKYIKPANTVSVTIYRRATLNPAQNGGLYWNQSNYWSCGRWEQIDYNDGGVAIGSTVTVNLRHAIDHKEFNAYYDPLYANSTTVRNSQGITNTLYAGQSLTPKTTGFTLLYGGNTQLLIVVNYTSGGNTVVSTKAIKVDMNMTNGYNPTGTYVGNVNQNSYQVTTADFNTIITVPAATNGVSIMRKISEARQPLATSVITNPTLGYGSGGWSLPTTSPTMV